MSTAALELLISLKDEASAGLSAIGGGLTSMAGLAAAGGLALTGAVVGVGAAAFDMASDVNQAANDMQAALGLTADEAQNMAQVAADVWANNWGDSIDDVSASLTTVAQNMGAVGVTSNEALSQATAAALALRDSFGTDVAESTDAATTLMQQFGLSSQQAFDFIASGMQQGLNRSGDFLDTIGEYSTQFAAGGATADGFFSLLQSGLQGGVLGTDKAADAFKEFRVRIQDGSTATSAGLQQLGIDSNQLMRQMASGQITAADAWQLVIGKLNDTDDANVRMQAGVALLGTQFEDLGTAGALALDMTNTSMADLEGATASLSAKYQNWGSLWEGFKRQALDAILPLGQSLLSLANAAMPAITAAIPPIVAGISMIAGLLTSGLEAGILLFVQAWQGLQPTIGLIYSAGTAIAAFVAGTGDLGTVADFLIDLFGVTLGGGIADFIGMITEAGNAIFNFVSGATGFVGLAFSLMEIFGPTIGGLIAQAVSVLNDYATVWIDLGTTIYNVVAALMSGDLAGAWAALTSGITQVITDYQVYAASLGQLILSLGQTIVGAVVTYAPIIAAQVLTWGTAFISWISPYIPIALGYLAGFAASVWGWIAAQAPVLLAQIGSWGLAFTTWISPYIPIALGYLAGFAASVWGWIAAQAPVLYQQVLTWGAAFVGWISPYITEALAKLGEFAGAIIGWIGEQAPGFAAQALTWGQGFVEWIGPKIPEVLAALGELANSAFAWVSEQAAPLLASFTAWATSLVEWIPGATVSFLAEWPKMFDSFLTWIGEQAGPLLAKLGEWAIQFVAWVAPQIPGILVAVAGIAAAILTWIAETVVVLAAKVLEWGAAFLGWIGTEVVPKLPGALAAIVTSISGWVGGAATTIKDMVVSIGTNLVDGIKQGISNAWGKFEKWIGDQVAKIPAPIRTALGIGSPSKLIAQTVGVPIAQGIGAGFDQALPKVTTNLVNGITNLAGKAATAIEAGTKAMSAAASYQGAGGTGLSGFLAGFSDMAIQFNDAAVALGGRILGTATRFADTIGKVTAPIDTALKALAGLVDFVAPARANITAFIASMYVLLNALNNMAAMFEAKAIKAAATFAEGAGKMLAVVGPAIDALKKLPDLVVPAQSQVNAFGESLFLIVRELLNVAALFAAQSLQAGAAFGEAGAKLLGVVAPAIDALKKLPELVAPADGALATFGDALGRTVQTLIGVAALFAVEAVQAAATFAESAGKVLGILKTSVDGLNAVREFGPIGYEAITAFAMAVDQMVALMAQVADDVGVAATDAAAKFSEGAGKVLGILKTGVDGLSGVRDLGPIGYAAIESFTMAVDQIVAYMAMAAEDVGVAAADAAAKFAGGAGAVLAIVKNGVDGLVGLRDLGPVGVTSITRFVMAVDQIVAYMAMAAEDVGVAAADAAAAFAAGAGKVLALLKTGVDGLTSLATFAAPAPKAIQAFGATIVAVLRQIEQVSAAFSAEAVASAAAFATNVSTVVGQLKGALQAFASLGDTGVKPAVLGAFMQAAQSLIAQMAAYLPPNAEVIGSNTIVGLINGIYGQRSNLIAAMTNTVLAAVQAAQATLGIASPSKVFEQLGQYTGQGMAGGMNAMQPAVASAGAGLGMAAVGGASGGVGSSRSGGAAGPINITFAAGAIAVNGVQGGLNDKHLKTLAGYIKEDIGADMRGR